MTHYSAPDTIPMNDDRHHISSSSAPFDACSHENMHTHRPTHAHTYDDDDDDDGDVAEDDDDGDVA